MKKDVVAGLGEIGLPIFKVFSKTYPTFGYDIDKNLMPNSPKKIESYSVRFLHICIPFNKFFLPNILKLNKKFAPEYIVIHSTVKPETTKKLQKRINIPVIYSPTRGVHKRMTHDLKRYTKFFALDDSMKNSLSCSRNYANLLKKSGIKSNKYAVDYDEMWTFSDEIHKFLGNRPKMFPGFIGGHCVIPNLELINENSLNSINQINNMFKKFFKKS